MFLRVIQSFRAVSLSQSHFLVLFSRLLSKTFDKTWTVEKILKYAGSRVTQTMQEEQTNFWM